MTFTPALLHGQAVTFTNKAISGTDEYGNDVYGANSVTVSGCAISPGNSSEDFQGTEQITYDVTVHAPAATLVNLPFDQMVISGITYNVIGNPNGWISPFTGTGSFLEIHGRIVTTGGASV